MVAYPTETFYGLGVDATREDALDQLVKLKGREPDKPFPVLVASKKQLSEYISTIPKNVESLMERYWPGPLTLILPCGSLPSLLSNARGGVGFRISSHAIARELPELLGKPITSTSANRAGEPPAGSLASVRQQFRNEKNLYLLGGGSTSGSLPSTVLDFTERPPRIVREGAIPEGSLKPYLSIT